MEGIKLGAMALISLVSLMVLRQWRPEWAPLVRITAATVFGGVTVAMASTVLTFVGDLGGETVSEETRQILLKALGLAFLTEVAAGICRDSGETSLASWVEMAGKLEILLLSLPLMEEILHLAGQLLGV